MEDCSVNISYFKKSAAEHLEHGRSPVYVAKDAKAQGMLVLETKSLPESAEVLDWLRNHGVSRLSLVSGDDHSVVQPLCALLPFDECLGNLGPEEKTTLIKELQGQGSAVCMVGDGVNDALALSTANVGVAIGAGGADAALEAADIVLMGENLQDIVLLRSLSLRSMRIVEQNFWIGAGSDYIGLGLGLLGLLTPLLGGIIHVGHTLAIMLNSSRLLAGGEAEAGPG
jgi:cation-transporting P-type ATPase C